MPRRLLLAACLTLLLLSTTASPAQAKGAKAVTISGPGLDAVRLTYAGQGVTIDTVANATLIYDVVFGPRPAQPSTVPAPDSLGPAYTVDYNFFGDHVRQTVYPLASPAPAIYVTPGQELYGAKVASRWVLAPPDLRRTLARLGAPLKDLAASAEAIADDQPAAAEPAAPEPADDQPAGQGSLNLWPLGAGLTVFGALALSWRLGRRRTGSPRRPTAVDL